VSLGEPSKICIFRPIIFPDSPTANSAEAAGNPRLVTLHDTSPCVEAAGMPGELKQVEWI